MTSYTWEFELGAVSSITDPNGTITSSEYVDPLDRLTAVKRATGTSDESHTAYEYDPSDIAGRTSVCTKQDIQSKGDAAAKRTCTVFDGLGREMESRLYETATAYISTARTYDGMGRPWQVSDPSRTTASAWTATTYDILNRPLDVTAPDSSKKKWVYSVSVKPNAP